MWQTVSYNLEIIIIANFLKFNNIYVFQENYSFFVFSSGENNETDSREVISASCSEINVGDL